MFSEQIVICSFVLLFCTALVFITSGLLQAIIQTAKQNEQHCLATFRRACGANIFSTAISQLTILALIFLPLAVSAQLSPGDLTKAHAHLEGMFNCTKCHVLGDKVSNEKCLDCHKEIKSRLNKDAGYHASRDVKGKDCTACHSDHHGRNFDIIRFDKKKFDHNLTGFKLTGAHQRIDCRQCHQPDFVEDRDLKKRSDTYLGLSRECLDCHDDYHQKTLSTDCAKCHTTTAFSPASRFDHNRSDFPLRGKHKLVDCKDCHTSDFRNGQAFQRFTGLNFSNCNSCHNDPHNYNLGSDCKQCHTEQSFLSLSGLKNFDHSETKFPLKGKHQDADCAGCHKMGEGATTIFQDRFGIRNNDCMICHQDVHEHKFGNNCAECHNERTFRMSGSMKNFNHNRTGFKLVGKHQAVDCRKCHTSGSLTDPLNYFTCSACHQDYHEGQMASFIGISPDCKKCHLETGFEESLFSIEDHAKTDFALDGGHVATPCFACHQQDEKKKWQFRNIGEKCADCHQDIHAGYLAPKFYPDKSCENCHLTASWEESKFDHTQTNYKLLGAHRKQSCGACHGKASNQAPDQVLKFAGTPTECAACHENVHGKQFEKNGITDCSRCHAFNNWEAKKFNHNNAAFKLDGKHRSVACSKCHKAQEENGVWVVQYKIKSYQCIDCHF